MNLLSLISPTSITAAMIVALSLSNVLFYKLWQGKSDDYAQLQAQVSLERRQAKDDAERAKERADRVSMDIATEYGAALDRLRKSQPAIRVLPATNCGVPHSNANPAFGLNVSPTLNTADPTAITAAECEAILSEAIEDSAQLAWLQHWFRQLE